MGKTAVIVIHGVGEQRPMGTVSGFTQFFAGKYYRSKVDYKSELYELRRLSTYVDDTNPAEQEVLAKARSEIPEYPASTVFFELYWAYHYRDTKMSLVIKWMLRTLKALFNKKKRGHLRRRIISVVMTILLVLLVFSLTAIAIGFGVQFIITPNNKWWAVLGAAIVALGTLIPYLGKAIQPIIIGWVGDAARYFGADPDNPIERQQIRKAGVDLLKRLHDDRFDGKPVYDNIVVVGHSLGSVLAYDIIMCYWNDVNRNIEIKPDQPELTNLEKYTKGLRCDPPAKCDPPTTATEWTVPTEVCAKEYQKMQTALVNSLSDAVSPRYQLETKTAATVGIKKDPASTTIQITGSSGVSVTVDSNATSSVEVKTGHSTDVKIKEIWRVRDLVTLGCPLTYARFLLAKDPEELFYRQTQRELPTCPPTKDAHKDEKERQSFVFSYELLMKKRAISDSVVPDQAAPFLLTRWTNLYFSQDPIGGPLGPIFGWGIQDHEVKLGNEIKKKAGPLEKAPSQAEPQAAAPDSKPAKPKLRYHAAWYWKFIDIYLGGAHVRYWDLNKRNLKQPASDQCADILRKIINNTHVTSAAVPNPPPQTATSVATNVPADSVAHVSPSTSPAAPHKESPP